MEIFDSAPFTAVASLAAPWGRCHSRAAPVALQEGEMPQDQLEPGPCTLLCPFLHFSRCLESILFCNRPELGPEQLRAGSQPGPNELQTSVTYGKSRIPWGTDSAHTGAALPILPCLALHRMLHLIQGWRCSVGAARGITSLIPGSAWTVWMGGVQCSSVPGICCREEANSMSSL